MSVLQDWPNEPLVHGKAALMTKKPSSTAQESQPLAGLDSDSMNMALEPKLRVKCDSKQL